jgi:replicative DNA helicase
MTTADSLLHSPADEFHLACALLSPNARIHLDHTLNALDPDDFHDPAIAQLWAAAKTIHTRGERITKRALLTEAPTARNPGFPATKTPITKARLDQISGEPVYIDKLPHSIHTIQETAKLRRLAETLERIHNHLITTHDYSQALSTTWELLNRLDDSEQPHDAVPFSTLTDDFHKTTTEQPEPTRVIPTPWDEVNDIFAGGLHPGRSFIVAGRPGAGKSLAGANLAAHAAENGHTTLIISEEMSNHELTGRLLAAGAHAEYTEIVKHAMSDWTTTLITEYCEKHHDMPLWAIDRPHLTIEHIAAIARTMKRTHNLELLFIDYLQLLDATDKTKIREQQISHISRAIKLLSRELDCAIITAAQLNRDNTKANRKPTLADLRESGSLEQDADAVILLHHETTEHGDPTGDVTLIIDKNRFGRKAEVSLRWRAHQARIG